MTDEQVGRMNPPVTKSILLTATLTVVAGCGAHDKYEVLERTQKTVPNYQGTGTHDVVDYVLLHDGHKIYAECDWVNLSNLDKNATCGFRAMRTYSCVQPSDNIEKETFPLSDLKCKDGAGHNVYLYVSKKE